MSNVVNATIADNTGVGTIINDEIGFAGASISKVFYTDELSATIYPNPATSVINVKLNGYSGFVTIQLRDMLGKVLEETKLQADKGITMQQQLNVTHIAAGPYFIFVLNEKGKQTIKFVKK